MTQTPIEQGIARWSSRDPCRVLITAEDGGLPGWYPVPLSGDRPGPEMLWPTGWSAYPGSGWQEEPPGKWTCAVYRHRTSQPGQQGTGRVP